MFGTSRRRLALLTGPLALAGVLDATAPAQAHGHKPASLTCQEKDIDRAAKVHYRAETFIKAPLRTVWNLQTDVEAWPSWQNPVLPVTMKRLDHGPFRKHSRFQRTIPVPPGMPYPPGDVTIVSTVRQLQPGKCIRWTGPQVDKDVPNSTEMLGQGLEIWLNDLKTAAGKR
ncbi:polyketide cyclase /reductase [Amycolatopsis sp. WAC 01376]|uniref:SRPBCC family protein n=1 Tax=Amycolatopsis sp. WAC 01376 TaxID=2203195 RepID=UPI000F77A14F|nr:SRPBCC family protein [Amycolatopsis sp. WAC 01376]RSM62793.1 polyketide cyclase /reductase [Amycolatopsis sp. WAC 01376]